MNVAARLFALIGELRGRIEGIGADDRIDMFVSASVITTEPAHE